jgi:integrase
MARKPLGLPAGIEVRGDSLRIRFTWNGERRGETLAHPPTAQGIKTASRLRDQVISLARHGVLNDEKYAELFPESDLAKSSRSLIPSFGQYTQLWLDSRDIVNGTRDNHKNAFNMYWMPPLGMRRIDLITPTLVRTIVAETEWASAGVIITYLYENTLKYAQIYAAFFEFVFFTGLRLSEALALRWDAVDLEKKHAHVCRTVALGVVEERTKTGRDRYVLLNERALHALEFARQYADRRKKGKGKIKKTPYIFSLSKNSEYVKQTSALHKQWGPALTELQIRYRPPYNCRHTYATICLMSGMNPAFISQQLGHSVQMLLSTYARWINSSSDWDKLKKLDFGTKLVPPSSSQS